MFIKTEKPEKRTGKIITTTTSDRIFLILYFLFKHYYYKLIHFSFFNNVWLFSFIQNLGVLKYTVLMIFLYCLMKIWYLIISIY